MPTVLRVQGFRFHCWSREPNEPPHVHVDQGSASAKVWLQPVVLAGGAGCPAREPGGIPGLARKHQPELLEACHEFFGATEGADIRVLDVAFSEHELIVALMDGRTIAVPLAWYPRLAAGTPEQRACWELAGAGYAIHWSELDEDLGTEGLLAGARTPRGSAAWRRRCQRARRHRLLPRRFLDAMARGKRRKG